MRMVEAARLQANSGSSLPRIRRRTDQPQAEAGAQGQKRFWIPVFTGMTCKKKSPKQGNQRSLRLRRHALLLEFFYSVRGFLDIADPQSFKHVRCFGELDVVIGDDFDSVAPGVAEIDPFINAL